MKTDKHKIDVVGKYPQAHLNLATGLFVAFLGALFFTPASSYAIAPIGPEIHSGLCNYVIEPGQSVNSYSSTAKPGETICFRGGLYNQEQLIIQNSGAPGQYITYRSYPDETATLDGTLIKVPKDQGLIYIKNASHIIIYDFTISKVLDADNNGETKHSGIHVSQGEDIWIKGNKIFDTCGPGINVMYADNVNIDYNELYQNNNGCKGEIIALQGSNKFTVRDNFVHDGGNGNGGDGGEGIDAKEGSSNGEISNNRVYNLADDVGIYLDGYEAGINDITVSDNRVYKCMNGIGIGSEGGGEINDIRVYNNILDSNKRCGIHIGGWVAGPKKINNISVDHNAVYNSTVEGEKDSSGIIILDRPAFDATLKVRNNIISKSLYSQLDIRKQNNWPYVVSHNLIDGPTKDEGTDAVKDSPSFVNPSGGDFHIKSDSKARDRGAVTDVNYDIDWQPRSGVYDIGIDEFYP